MLLSDTARKFHKSINNEWDFLQRADQTLVPLSQYYGQLQNGENNLHVQYLILVFGAYRLSSLKESKVFGVDFPKLLQMKATLLQLAMISTMAADIRDDDWLQKLPESGCLPERNTVWVLEVLNIIAANCNQTHTVLLADFMNKSSTTLSQPNRLRKLPRSMQTNQDDNKPCCRLYLASASGSPDKKSTRRSIKPCKHIKHTFLLILNKCQVQALF
ncbi:hypothetical protein MKW92_007173 [Papaver armeniacum]|nr:hypothetical protein MKW92_007173 [Papaver armeniacum]